MSFDEKLRKLRKDNKLSQEELADKLKISRQAVSKWESGSAYPEMEKLLELCKIFNCTLEELTNSEVVIEDNKSKSYVSMLGYYIKKTINLFSNMSFSEILKIIITMFIIALCITIIRIPIHYLINIGDKMFMGFDNVFCILLNNIWGFLLNIIYVVGSVFLFLYAFKVKYLDNYEMTKSEKVIVNEEGKKEVIKEKIVIKNNNNDHKFINFVIEVIMLGIKALVLFASVPFIIATVMATFGLVIIIWLFFNGIPFIGALIGDIFGIVLLILILILVIHFVFNKKINIKKVIITFVVGLLGLGIGCGIFALEMTRFDITDRQYIEKDMSTITKEYPFNSNLIINSYYSDNIEYVENEELTDKVVIEVSYYKNLNYPYFRQYNNTISIYSADDELSKEIIEDVIDGLKENKIYNYDFQQANTIKIYSSNDNLNTIKNNSLYN